VPARRKRTRRAAASYRSADPDKRARQLANLRPGGVSRLTHGAYAPIAAAQFDAKTREIFQAIAADAPVQDHGGLPAADSLAVAELARVLIRRDRIVDYVNRRGYEDDSGNVRPVVSELAKMDAVILNYLEALGMTPRSRAKLGLDLARLQSPQDRFAAKLEGGEQ
jgi:ABC-type sulfate transport system substrate-binding protein